MVHGGDQGGEWEDEPAEEGQVQTACSLGLRSSQDSPGSLSHYCSDLVCTDNLAQTNSLKNSFQSSQGIETWLKSFNTKDSNLLTHGRVLCSYQSCCLCSQKSSLLGTNNLYLHVLWQWVPHRSHMGQGVGKDGKVAARKLQGRRVTWERGCGQQLPVLQSLLFHPSLWAQRSADPGSKAAHLLCTPRTLSSRISHEDLPAWLRGAVRGTCLFCRARELILRGKGGGHLPGMESSLDLTQWAAGVGTECKRWV